MKCNESVTHLSFGNDVERVTSGTLPDDVLAIVIMRLWTKRQRGDRRRKLLQIIHTDCAGMFTVMPPVDGMHLFDACVCVCVRVWV